MERLAPLQISPERQDSVEPLRLHEIPFFTGERLIGTVSVPFLPRNGITRCVHRIRWQWMMGRNVSCGQTVRYSLEKRRGITVEHRRELESVVKGTLKAGYLTSLNLELKGSMGETVTLENEVSERDEFEYTAKDCYDTEVQVFQLQSVLDLSCEWKPWLRRKKYWEKTVTINHNRLQQQTRVQPSHASCGCSGAAGEQSESIVATTGELSLVEPFIVHNKQLYFFTLNLYLDEDAIRVLSPGERGPWPPAGDVARDWSVDPDDMVDELVERLLRLEEPLPAAVLPAHLRYLAGLSEADMTFIRFQRPLRSDKPVRQT